MRAPEPSTDPAESRATSGAGGSRPLAGVAWMLLTGIFFVGVTGVVKHVGSEVPAAQAAFLRYVLGLVFFLPLLGAMLRLRLSRRDWSLYGLRSAVHTLGVLLWFYAMTQIPIAEVTAMNYLVPVLVAVGAALVFGERLAARRIAAIVVALIGALIILRPGVREVGPGHLAMLGTASFFAISYLIAKHQSGRTDASIVVALLSVGVTIGLAPFAAAVWVPPTLPQLGWLGVTAALATAGHYSMTRAFAVAPLTVTQLVTFTQLIWAATLGALVFGEMVDPWVIAGGVLIMGAVLFITWREARLRGEARTPPAEATKH